MASLRDCPGILLVEIKKFQKIPQSR